MITDQKISKHTTNRKPYYAPTERDVQCFNLVTNESGDIVVVHDVNDTHEVRKRRLCLCSQPAPFCSYALGQTQVDAATGETQYICQRYEFMKDSDTIPADTHNKVLKVSGRELKWT